MPLFPVPRPLGGLSVAGIPVEFILFALTLLGVALFHHKTFLVALLGMSSVAIYKIAFTGFKTGAGVAGFAGHLGHEWVTLANLLCLLLGFAILARQFEDSRVPEILPKFLPNDWKGAFVLLAMVWFISSFLDNIAAALIGGAMAHKLFKGKVHIGYLAAIVAINPNLFEAAQVDGAGRLKQIWHVLLPGIRPTIVILLILNIGNLLNTGFDQYFLLGNSLTREFSDVIDTYSYRYGLQNGMYSYATAVGMFKSLVAFLMVFTVNQISKKLEGSHLF